MPNLESLTLPIKVGSTKTNVKYDIPQGNVLQEDLEDYAKNNGYYDEFTAGSAEQLLSSQFVEDSVPYKFRTSGGSKDIGNREYDEIVGGSIVWNQLASLLSMSTMTYNGITYTYNSATNTYTVSGTASATSAITLTESNINLLTNHVYYLPDIRPSGTVGMYFVNGYYANYSKMFKMTQNETNRYLTLRYQSGVAPQNEVLKMNCQLFDLTAMFGSQIADHIYSLEQAEAGKGVAFFKSLFPNDYYPYNAGELLSVEGLQSHDTVEFNQWDEEWELGTISPSTGEKSSASDRIRAKNLIPVLPNTTYYSTIATRFLFYDDNETYLGINDSISLNSAGTFTTPSNAHYMAFGLGSAYGTTYKNDICINLSWSGWRNGEYEPYKKHSYALDSSLTLRGIPKLNAQNELYFDGDKYTSDGKVKRNVFRITFNGSEDWLAYPNEPNLVYLTFAFPDDKVPQYILQNEWGISNNGMVCCDNVLIHNQEGKRGMISNSSANQGKNLYILLPSNVSNVSEWKTFLSSNNLVIDYIISTPTEEESTPYTSPQAVDDFGTEEYISGNVVPVGHNTQYPANLRDKLQHLPNLADNDGYYMISQQNKQMSLELFRIPKAPTIDGTYTLKATVSGGTPTYVWESEETE